MVLAGSITQEELAHYSSSQLLDLVEKQSQQLQQQESRHQAFIEACSQGYWDWNITDNQQYLSAGFCAMLGLDTANKQAPQPQWQALILPEDLPCALQCLQQKGPTGASEQNPTVAQDSLTLGQGTSAQQQALRYRHRDGSIIHVLFCAQVLAWDEKGHPLRIVATHTDISQIKQAQEFFAEESKVKSEFLANVSHELRSPLNSILLLLHVLLENKQQNLNTIQLDNLQVMQHSGKDLLMLINDLLDHSKLSKGKIDIALEKVTVLQLTNTLDTSFATQFHNKGLIFVVENHCPDGFSVLSDPRRLEQIIRNFITNAYKFTPVGGTVKVCFQVLQGSGKHLQISVSDSGVGIDSKELSTIFDHFEQGKEGRKRKHQGSGLGLAIAKNLAQLLSCTIDVSSAPGEGASFTLKVPQQPPGSLREKGPVSAHRTSPSLVLSAEESAVLQGRRVLIVDDDLRNIFALRQILLNHGLHIYQATDGNAGLDQARQHQAIDVIMMDIMMPELNGYSAAEQIRQLPHCQTVPIIAMSGHEDIRHGEFQQSQFDYFFKKPIEIELLFTLLLTLFEREN